MAWNWRCALAAACAGLLAACGSDGQPSGPDASSKAAHRSATQQAGDYAAVVQQLYLAYFGRPADPAGLANFEAQLLAAGAPADIQSLVQAYGSNPAVQALIDAFGTSAESQTLYGNGTTDDFITAVFEHVLSRAPQPGGMQFWEAQLGSGLSKGNAALAIMAGALANTSAQGKLDAALIDNRIAVAEQFSASVSSENAAGAYRGAPAAGMARALLAGVTASSNAGSYQAAIDQTIAALPTALSFSYSPYKEVSSGGRDGNGLMYTSVGGSAVTQTSAMPGANTTLTWAFAAGNCGAESWDGIDGATFAEANVPAFVNAGKYYIVSTGGWGQQFKCASNADFIAFIKRYYSSGMLGVDFDIEGGSPVDWTQADVDNLVQCIVNAQQSYPNLRFSFTVGTTGGTAAGLSSYGQMVLQAIGTYGMKDYLINLMVMDYGPNAASDICVVSSGACEMGASAVQAAVSLHTAYGIPYKQIELTPMIGQNDSTPDIFQVSDIATVSGFVRQNGLAGVHFWSFDRDADCAYDPSGPSATCNGVGNAGTLGYTKGFMSALFP
ncbi:MAG TPA: DUF4214 domain-containing protein [Burkholderiaceae bacterium]